MTKARHALEHELWKSLGREGLVGARFLLACSGGADSVAMVRAFAAVRPAAELIVAHVHHGEGNDRFRAGAEKFVAELARALKLRLIVDRHHGPPLKSEKELRRHRRRVLESQRAETGCDFIVTAHHRDDLLETRLIRLVRGTGPEGLPAIRPRRGVWYRPFLETSAKDLRAYLKALKQPHLEDPTNADPRHLRNWIRGTWLGALEDYRPGAMAALGRSLDSIVAEMTLHEPPADPVIARPVWEKSAPAERLRLLSGCLQAAGQLEMTRGQLEEIRRRLDNRRREYTFFSAGCDWSVNVQQITARRRG